MPDSERIIPPNPLKHIRTRPGMYIGGTGVDSLHHLVEEGLDLCVEEVFAGHCDHIRIVLHPNSEVTVRDKGAGLPVDRVKDWGQSRLELLLVHHMAGPSGPDHLYHVQGGLHGVGISVTNALSETFTVEVARDGYLWRQSYRQGLPQSDVIQVRVLESGESTGTTVTFTPDFTILERNDFSYERLAERVQELAYLLPGTTLELRDERVDPPREEAFHAPGGLVAYVEHLNRDKLPLHPPIHARHKGKGTMKNGNPCDFEIDFALQFSDSETTTIRGYINTVQTVDGGIHLKALHSAIVNAINHCRHFVAPEGQLPSFSQQEVEVGLTVVISLKHSSPIFASLTRLELLNLEIEAPIFGLVFDSFTVFLQQNPEAGERIIHKCIANRHL